MDIRYVQEQNCKWVAHNFPGQTWHQHFMGMVEELGELSHALLKQDQGIRGRWGDHEEEAKDAVGDLFIFALSLCNSRGWSLEQIIQDTWTQVQRRDWIAFPIDGVTK